VDRYSTRSDGAIGRPSKAGRWARRAGCVFAAVLCAIAAGAGAEMHADAEEAPAAPALETCAGKPAATTRATAAQLLEPPAAPTVVELAMYVTEVSNIDVMRDSASFSGYAEFTWCDPRQAFDAAQAGVEKKTFMGENSLKRFAVAWQPDLRIANGIGAVRVSKRVITVKPDGTTRVEGLFDADIAVDYDLRRFPLDRQVIPIQIESFTWNADHMTMRALTERVGFSDAIAIAEWRITGIESRVETASDVRNDRPFSRFTVDLHVARESGFYLYKVAMPLCLIVALTWAVFWMKDEPFAGRTRVSLTGVLTIVAYQFAIGNTLPRVPYLTLMDKLMIASFTLIAVTVVENLLVAHYQENNPAIALRIDRTSRWLFPVVFATLIALVALPVLG
jgi:hypothetical protein